MYSEAQPSGQLCTASVIVILIAFQAFLMPSPPLSSPSSSSSSFLQPAYSRIDAHFAGQQPYQITRSVLLYALLAFAATSAASSIARHGLRKSVFGLVLGLVRRVPYTRSLLQAEQQKTVNKLHSMIITPEIAKEARNLTLPTTGTPGADLLPLLRRWAAVEKANWSEGQASGTVYHGGSELTTLEAETFALFCLSNPLHPDVFCYVRKMEAEVVAMTARLFHGDDDTCGSMTSGGTESILMAMKAYRDRHQAAHPGSTPQIIASSTAHAAFAKAAHYFAMELVTVPVDPDTFMLDPAAVQRAVTRDTCVIVASAPAFPHGVVDPVPKLSALAVRLGLPLHVDCCLGSFLIPFAAQLGYPGLPAFDFALPGVTSLSCDTHKYGYAVKGSSVILYRHAAYRAFQYFVAPDWSGGIYASPSMPGSRPGGLIAATWVALMAMGEDGYRAAAREIMEVAKEIERGVRGIAGLRVLGAPALSVIAFASTDPQLNIYAVNEAMNTRHHWSLNTLQHPSALHLCVTLVHKGCGARFVKDLEDSVRAVREEPERFSKGSAAIYGMAASIPDTTIVDDLARGYIDALYTA